MIDHPRIRRAAPTALAAFLALVLAFGAFWATFPTADASAQAQAPAGVVVVYPGVERPGLERTACLFLDGYLIMSGEISQGRLIVTDPLNNEFYRSLPIAFPEGYVVRSLQCIRSSQSGFLVVVAGGLVAGTNTQQRMTLSTDYPIREPINHEEYLAGQR